MPQICDSVMAALWATMPSLLTATIMILAAWMLLVAHAGTVPLFQSSGPALLPVAACLSLRRFPNSHDCCCLVFTPLMVLDMPMQVNTWLSHASGLNSPLADIFSFLDLPLVHLSASHALPAPFCTAQSQLLSPTALLTHLAVVKILNACA